MSERVLLRGFMSKKSEMEKMFGKFTDEEIAKTHNTTLNYIQACRHEKGAIMHKPIDSLLGIFTDKEISEKLNISVQAVVHTRLRRGIKPVKKKNIDRKERSHKQKCKKYGISAQDYDILFEKQDGRCAICRKKTDKRLSIDHDHNTGKVRALLCNSCNLMLGFARDNKTILRLAIDYLKRFIIRK
jgi:hypothetical protein